MGKTDLKRLGTTFAFLSASNAPDVAVAIHSVRGEEEDGRGGNKVFQTRSRPLSTPWWIELINLTPPCQQCLCMS